jgi:hypothetical protein
MKGEAVFDHILLEPEQEDLLAQLVEAARSVPRAKREAFVIVPWGKEPHYEINHPAFSSNLQVYWADLDALRYQRLLAASPPTSSDSFEVTLEGFAYYRELKQRSASPLNQVEIEIRE